MGKKKGRKAAPPRPLTKKQRSRVEREARMNRWIIIGAATIGILVVAILVYGYLSEEVFRAREPVAKVNGVPITTEDFEVRVRYQRLGLRQELDQYLAQRMLLDPTDPETTTVFEQLDQIIRSLEAQLAPEYAAVIGGQVLQQMVQEELIRQEAARRGLSVSQEEIERAIERQFGYDRDASEAEPFPPISGPVTETTQTITPTGGITLEEFQQRYQGYVKSVLEPSGLSEKEFRAMVEVSLLYDKVRQAVSDSVPAVMDQVQFRYISFPSEEEAAAVQERLEAGEAWEDIAAEIEAEEGGGAYVTEMDWRTESYVAEQFGEEIGQAVFETPVGELTGVLLGSSGRYYVIQITGHEERELDSLMQSYEQNRAFQAWFELQMQYVEYVGGWEEKVPTQP